MNDKLMTYRTAATLGRSQLDLIIQVYDGAVEALRKAAEAYKNGRSQLGYERLQRAKRFVTHLYATLDPAAGGEIAQNLGQLYAFVLSQLTMVEATKDLSLIDDNICILENLRRGWLELRERERADGQRQPGSAASSLAKHVTRLA